MKNSIDEGSTASPFAWKHERLTKSVTRFMFCNKYDRAILTIRGRYCNCDLYQAEALGT